MYMSYFTGEDLVFYKENDQIMSGGYSIDSILLKQGIAPITTFNTPITGGRKEQVSNLFENLAVPAGLLYIHHKPSFNEHNYDEVCNHDVLSDDIHDQLFALVELQKPKKQKTRKIGFTKELRSNLSRKNKNKNT
uniref:Uncharacterized protein n=1 Tax=viral metagenome TaxID=1070528 RepID=A0A6C0E612_9ZZZZ